MTCLETAAFECLQVVLAFSHRAKGGGVGGIPQTWYQKICCRVPDYALPSRCLISISAAMHGSRADACSRPAPSFNFATTRLRDIDGPRSGGIRNRTPSLMRQPFGHLIGADYPLTIELDHVSKQAGAHLRGALQAPDTNLFIYLLGFCLDNCNEDDSTTH